MNNASEVLIKLTLMASIAILSIVGCQFKHSSVPGSAQTRLSGQSSMMDQTFAGQNKCNPNNHLRPFIIEWDATDMSSFEAITANDVVFVHYEGCELTVLDGCRNDQIRGSLGA